MIKISNAVVFNSPEGEQYNFGKLTVYFCIKRLLISVIKFTGLSIVRKINAELLTVSNKFSACQRKLDEEIRELRL